MRRREGQASARAHFYVISVRSLFRRFKWLRLSAARRRRLLQHGAYIVSALFYAYAALVAWSTWEQTGAPLECGIPVLSPADATSPERFSGVVAAADLPWATAPPERLLSGWRTVGSERLVAAFRITLPNPLWNEAQNVAVAARYLSGVVIDPGETVSVIDLIGPFTAARGYGDGPGYAAGRLVPVMAGGVCKIGTAMYNVAVHGGLTVLERHPHSMVVPYVAPGRDAAIATGYKDVRIRNDYDRPLLLWADMEETTLFVALYGDVEPPIVEWRHEELAREAPPLERRPNPVLSPGEERLIFAGYDGLTVRTSIVITRPDRPPETKVLSTDTYRPLRGIVEYGP